MSPMVIALIIAPLALAAALAIARVVRAGVVVDRVVGFDVLMLVLVALVAADAAARRSTEHLELTLVVGLLGFLGTITAAVYLLSRQGEKR